MGYRSRIVIALAALATLVFGGNAVGQPTYSKAGPRYFYEQASDPGALANRGILYTKDDAGDTELYYKDPLLNVIQITKDGGINVGAIAAVGADTQVQFNDGGVFGADAGLTYVKGTDALTVVGALASATLDTGQGAYELFAMDQDVEAADAVTFATVDTGQGANELYDMDQNVQQADSPTFVGLTLSGAIATPTDISMTGELDMTGDVVIDLNPSTNTGSPLIVDLVPSAAIGADVYWRGFKIDGNALDPTGSGARIRGYVSDMTTVDTTNSSDIRAAAFKSPIAPNSFALWTQGTNQFEYTSPADAAAQNDILNVIVDASAQNANSGTHAIDVAAAGNIVGSIAAVATHTGIDVIHQHIGTYTTPSQTEYAARWPDGGAWTDGIDGHEIFVADNDAIYIGNAAVFDELQVIMGTPATKNVVPEFFYYDTSPAWIQFIPGDDTGGFIQDGTIGWDSDNFTNWKSDYDPGGAGGSAGYYIKIVRTNNADPGTPTPTTIKLLAGGEEYGWDSLGAITALSYTDGSATLTTGTLIGITTAITGTANNVMAISVPDQPDTGNVAGVGLTITADQAGEQAGGGGAGGSITLTAGDAGGDTGNLDGGDIIVKLGDPINSGGRGALRPLGDDLYNLGSSTNEWHSIWIDGTANIDSLVADTADINGGTVDGITSLTAAGDLDIGAHDFQAQTLSADGLTTTRLVVVGADGLLSDATVVESAGALSGITSISATGLTTLTGGQLRSRTAVNDAAYEALAGDYIIAYTAISAARTITVTDALCDAGRVYKVQDEAGAAGTFNLTIDPEGGTLINDVLTYVINTDHGHAEIYCNGTNWFAN